jgi:hypothetical protein
MAEKSTLGLAPCSFNYDTKKLHQFFNFTREMSDVFVTILVMLVLVLCEPTQCLASEFNCGAFSAILGTLQTTSWSLVGPGVEVGPMSSFIDYVGLSQK